MYLGNAIFHNFLGYEVGFVANEEFLDVVCRVALNFLQPHPNVLK